MSELVIAEKQDLINIANAIREKTETTDGIGLDEMAALIAAIESGEKITAGSITKASDDNIDITITHGLGVIPDWLVMMQTRYTSQTYKGVRIFVFARKRTQKYDNDYSYIYSNENTHNVTYMYDYDSSLNGTTGFGHSFSLDTQLFTMKAKTSGSTPKGATWEWIAIGGLS